MIPVKRFLFITICLLVTACDFTIPLSIAPEMAIDKRATGLWERSKPDDNTERLLVLPFNEREYFVSWPEDAPTELYAKSHLFEFNGQVLVQVEWFGNSDGIVPDDNRNFQIASYNIKGDQLEIRLLNTGVVGKDFKSSAELASAIENNSDNPDLYLETMAFTKVQP